MKHTFTYILAGILIAAIVLVSFFALQNVNQITTFGTISTDTTWQGTVNLSGNVTVNSGVQFTIQPGTTVNLNSSALQIDGTLVAKGNGNQKITFNGGQIIFTATSSPWNEQTGSGSIIDNCISSAFIMIRGASPKITDSVLNASHLEPLIIGIEGGAPIISNNQITGNVRPVTYGYGGGDGIMLGSDSNAIITGNTIQNCMDGIAVSSLMDSFTGTVTIQRNLLVDNKICGVFFGAPQKVVFGDNTVTGNYLGFRVTGYSDQSVFANNNIYDNTNRTISLETSHWSTGMEVPNNWWGTTDTTAISQSIHDSKIDPQLGTVNFTPILQAENQNAPKP